MVPHGGYFSHITSVHMEAEIFLYSNRVENGEHIVLWCGSLAETFVAENKYASTQGKHGARMMNRTHR